jgi:DNA-binding HxlR family transcriptional regulator
MKDITPKVLSERLKELESEGLIKRQVDTSNFPIKSEYWLTESGLDFMPVISLMKSWALQWKPHQKICESVDCKNCEL